MHRRPSSQAVQNVARCSRVWHSQCLCSCMLFNKKAYILTKRALSSSLSQCDAACPASEQCKAAAHTGYSRASLDGASVDRAVKAAMPVPERVGSYSGDLALATRCDKARIYPSIQTQTPRFNGVVQSLTLPRNALFLRQEVCNLLGKGAIEKVPQSELECGFYSRYFVVPKRDGGLRPILDLRPINRALCKCPFRMLTLKQILAQIRPGDWFASVDLKDAYFHIRIAPHHRHFLRFAFEGTAYQYSVLPFGLALAPRTFSKCMDAALSPLRASGMRILNYLDDWLILAQSQETLLSHIDTLLRHLESLGLCVNMQKSILAPSQSITYLGVCFDSVEMRARLSRERSAAILSSLRHFRLGSSVRLKEFQRLLGLMASASAVCHLGLLHMRPLQLWLKSRVPWTAWTSGRLRIAVSRGCIEALRPWRDPDLFSRGVPLGLVTSRVVVTTDASSRGWGAVCEGMPASGLWSEPQSRWHINRLELEAVFLALKDFQPLLE